MTAYRTPEQALIDLALVLPAVRPPAGSYVHAVRAGELLFTAGHVPVRADGSVIFGKLGADLDEAAGREAARAAALGMLATVREELGSLDRVRRVVRIFGTVNATSEFGAHTPVIDGASDLLIEVFAEAGKHARLAVGVSSLPWNIALEVEGIFQVE